MGTSAVELSAGAGSAPARPASFWRDVYWICWREMKRFAAQRARIVMIVIQPLFWLVLMGNSLSGLTANPAAARILGAQSYLAFMVPGVMVMTALFGGVFGGMTVVWDRRMGYLNKMLAAPVARSVIPIGKMLATALQGMIQVSILIAIAYAMGVRFATGLPGLAVALAIAALFAFGMAGVSLALSAVMRSHEALMAIGNFLTMPLMFSSNAIFPIEAMPAWLQAIARVNPLTYAVTPIRTLATSGWNWGAVGAGLAGVAVFASIMAVVAGRQFERSIA